MEAIYSSENFVQAYSDDAEWQLRKPQHVLQLNVLCTLRNQTTVLALSAVDRCLQKWTVRNFIYSSKRNAMHVKGTTGYDTSRG